MRDGFQDDTREWCVACFGAALADDRTERNHRFLEEALELVQSAGCTRAEAHQLVEYVFDRPTGDPYQEAGGAIVTLALLCSAIGINLNGAGNTELARVRRPDIMAKIQAKQKLRPRFSPLPVPLAIDSSEARQAGGIADWIERELKKSRNKERLDPQPYAQNTELIVTELIIKALRHYGKST